MLSSILSSKPARESIAQAAIDRKWDTVRELFNNRHNPDELGALERGALHYAVLARHHDTVALLLKKANPNIKTKDRGETPLHMACIGGNEIDIKLLLLHGAKTTIEDDRKRLPSQVASSQYIKTMMEAFAGKYNEIEKLLTDAKNHFLKNNHSSAMTSLDRAYLALVDILKEEKENIVRTTYVTKVVAQCKEGSNHSLWSEDFSQLIDKVYALAFPDREGNFKFKIDQSVKDSIQIYELVIKTGKFPELKDETKISEYTKTHFFSLSMEDEKEAAASEKEPLIPPSISLKPVLTEVDQLIKIAKSLPDAACQLFDNVTLSRKLNTDQLVEIAKSHPTATRSLLDNVELSKKLSADQLTEIAKSHSTAARWLFDNIELSKKLNAIHLADVARSYFYATYKVAVFSREETCSALSTASSAMATLNMYGTFKEKHNTIDLYNFEKAGHDIFEIIKMLAKPAGKKLLIEKLKEQTPIQEHRLSLGERKKIHHP